MSYPRRRKKVCFPDDKERLQQIVGDVPNLEDMTKEELGDIFFRKQEFNDIRRSGKLVSAEVERRGYGRYLVNTFSEKNSQAQNGLNAWVLLGGKGRGLERWSNREHGERRESDQFQALMAVLGAQDAMMAERGGIDPEKLRKVAHKASRMARHFARMMGKADRYAVENMNDVDEESIKTTSTQLTAVLSVSSILTEDDVISLPRISTKINNSAHIEKLNGGKSWRRSRLPGLWNRQRNRSKARQERAEVEFNV